MRTRPRPRTHTARGLRAAVSGEYAAIAVAVLYFLAGRSVPVVVVGFAITGVVGIVSIVRVWRGQHEFGPEHRRMARRGTYLFVLASVLFVLAFLSFQTFSATSLGIDFEPRNETSAPGTHRFRDLEPPLVLLGAALLVEALSGAHVLWELVGREARRAVIGYAIAGGVGAVASVGWGLRVLADLKAEAGPRVETPQEAEAYLARLLDSLLPLVLLVVAATRVAALALLRRARRKVADAENEPAESVAAAPT